MQEIVLEIDNTFPFNIISKDFKELKFYRWCNSSIDYLEFYGENEKLDKLDSKLDKVEKKLGTKTIYKSRQPSKMTLMLSCSCSIHNSSIRVAESLNCLWKGPVMYANGVETLTLIVVEGHDLMDVISVFKKNGNVSLIKSIQMMPDSLRSTYTLSISSLFNQLTEKQAHMLKIAIESGYFKIPKNTHISHLAKRGGLSVSTAQEHLNKAKSKLMKNMEPYINLYLTLMEQNNV
ncbi:MAG: helix-turn-helix domain-containing protein [Cuniculiplasma sp.]